MDKNYYVSFPKSDDYTTDMSKSDELILDVKGRGRYVISSDQPVIPGYSVCESQDVNGFTNTKMYFLKPQACGAMDDKTKQHMRVMLRSIHPMPDTLK